MPVVALDVWYHVGSRDEVAGKTGFAHLFEHMMFQGSAHVADKMHFKYIQEAGGTANGSTNTDRTNYFETLPSNYLETGLWLESDRMGFLLATLTKDKLDNQRDVVRNEKRQNYDNRPYGLAPKAIFENIYPPVAPVSPPDHRRARGSRARHARRRERVLQEVLLAGERDAGHRRRRRRGRRRSGCARSISARCRRRRRRCAPRCRRRRCSPARSGWRSRIACRSSGSMSSGRRRRCSRRATPSSIFSPAPSAASRGGSTSAWCTTRGWRRPSRCRRSRRRCRRCSRSSSP